MASTRKYTDSETKIEFSITGDWPWRGKDELAKERAAPIVSGVSTARGGKVFVHNIAGGIDTVSLDYVAAKQFRILDFQFGPCNVTSTDSATSYDLTVTAPSGEKDHLLLQDTRIQYRDINAPIDLQWLFAAALVGRSIALPFDVVLAN